jgi:hypothetical protein
MQVSDQTNLKIIKSSSKGAESVELKLDKPISKELLGKVINAKITKMHKDGTVRLTLPNGKHITGKLAKPLPEGTQITFTTNAEGKVKVLQIKIPENRQPQNPQGDKDNNQQNNTQSSKEQLAKQPVTQQGAKQATTAFQTIDKTMQQPVKIQTVAGKPLPLNLGTSFEVTLTSSTPKNGFYQALLPDAKNTKINIQLPKELPKGTRLTIRILAHNEAKIMDVKPPQTQTVKINKTQTEITTKPVIPQQQTSKTQPVSTTIKPVVTEKISLSGLAQNKLSEASATTNITTTNPQVLQQVKVIIPQTAKLDLIAQVIKVLQPETKGTPTKDLPHTSSAKDQPAPTQKQSEAPKTQQLTPIKNIKIPMTNVVKLPLNTPIMGQVKTLQIPTNTTPNTPTHTLNLPQGVRFDVNSSLPIAKGATMAIRFTSKGVAEVLRIVEPTPVSAKKEQGGKQQGTNTGGAPAKTDAPAHHLEKALKLTPGTRFTAIVSSKSDSGLQTLALPDGRKFQAHSTKPLPIGAEVTVKITPNGDAEITKLNLPQASAKTDALLEFSRKWENLEKALQVLKQSHPEAASKIEGKLPNPASKTLLPSLLQFAEAVSSQNAIKFLGNETLNLLKSLGIDFTADLSQLNQLQQKTDAPDNWRAFYFPFMTDENNPDQGSFYWRNQEGEDQEKNTRFVVNLSLSELGPVQIDGLMQENHMMLKLRLHDLPSPNFEQELNDIIQKILEPLEIQGKVKVEISNSFETDPLHDLLQSDNHTGLVV